MTRSAVFISMFVMFNFYAAGSSMAQGDWLQTDDLLVTRASHTATLLLSGEVLVTGGDTFSGEVTNTSELYDPNTDTWSITGNLIHPRMEHTATLLPSGKVLVAGGVIGGYLSSAELYDPESGQWSSTGDLLHPRGRHTATLLPTGKVLVVGGKGSAASMASAELYDPETEMWMPANDPLESRYKHTATLLQSGNVLIVGGLPNGGAAEIYNPLADSWATGGDLVNARWNHTATLLASGKVIVFGGGGEGSTPLSSTEIYNPETGLWASAGINSLEARGRHTAVLLTSGKVLVVGGYRELLGDPLNTALVYDPATEEWTPSLTGTRRGAHSATLLPSGEVLIAGGQGGFSPTQTTEVYRPSAGEWSCTGNLEFPRSDHTATLLESGDVLVAGGTNAEISLAAVEILDPITGQWSTGNSLGGPRAGHTATLLGTGEVLVAGGSSSRATELWNPVTGEWRSGGDLETPRSLHTATLLSSGKILATGGFGTGGALRSAELYDPITDQWTNTGDLAFPRVYHAAILLDSGKVLVIGNIEVDVPSLPEVYDPTTGEWTATELNDTPRVRAAATLLPSGKVLVSGGIAPNRFITQRSEIYSPDTGQWVRSVDMLKRRAGHSMTLMPFGQVLVLNAGSVPEFFDSRRGQWNLWEPLASFRSGPTTTLLTSGEVLVVGMDSGSGTGTCPMGGEIYRPDIRSSDHLPTIHSTSSPIRFDTSFSVTGDFRGDSEAGGGTAQSSEVNFPIIFLRTLDGRRHYQLVPEPRLEAGANFWDDSITLTFNDLPTSLNPGPHVVTAVVAGIPSDPVVVEMECSIQISNPLSVHPTGAVQVGETLTIDAETAGVRRWQWQKDGIDIPGATTASYTTPPVSAVDAGTTYRVVVENDCTSATSENVTLEVFDDVPPIVEHLEPSGGEYWPLSDPGEDPQIELVSWEVSDNVRVCQVAIELLYSVDGGMTYEESVGGGLPFIYGPGGACSFDERVQATSVEYMVPTTPPSGIPGSLYKVQIEVTDQASNAVSVMSTHPFFIVQPNPDTVKTLILGHLPRMGEQLALSEEESTALSISLQNLANHPRVLGLLVDLGATTDLIELYASWDADRANSDRANQVLFGCHAPLPPDCTNEKNGIHDLLRGLLRIYGGVESIVLVGDDRIIPMARIQDRTGLFSEQNYPQPMGGDLTPTGTSVGEALAANKYLSDDPLAVKDAIHSDELNGSLFLPDVEIGRLVETPAEISTTIATYISRDGILDLSELDPETGHLVQVTGYDFLRDSAAKMRRRWQRILGDSSDPADLEPVDGQLIGQNWDDMALLRHLCGNESSSYGLISLNGHASHYQEGIPGSDPFDIRGLSATDIVEETACASAPLDLTGSVLFAVGCHGGLSVPGSDPSDGDNSLDLPQSFLSRGAVAYVANSGYGWGLKHGVGYSERLVELFNEEMSRGGSVRVGGAVLAAKQRYVLEAPRFDPYDEKTLMQWTMFGLPMYAVDPGISVDTESGPPGSKASLSEDSAAIDSFGSVRVERQLQAAKGLKGGLPTHLTRLELRFEFSEEGVYNKYNASGELLSDVQGCPAPEFGEPEGCYYTLNGLVERSTGIADHPIQPFFIYDSRLSGTSQHGVLWLGGEYEEEAGWVPIIAELASNGGDGSNHGVAPRLRRSLPSGPRLVPGVDPPQCRPSDLEVNSVVVTAGEVLKQDVSDPVYNIQRTYLDVDLEVFYFNNPDISHQNCDRTGPELEPGFGDAFHQVNGTVIDWAVMATDDADIWRVVVVYNDGSLDEMGRGRWSPLELSEDNGVWRGRVNFDGEAQVSYLIQAVDRRGNVGWVEYIAAAPPASGVSLEEPEVIDVDIELGRADLGITMTDAPDPVQVGSPLHYTLTAYNDGPDLASAVEVTDQLPTGTHLVIAGGEGWDCVEHEAEVMCVRDYLASGEIAPPITVAVTAPSTTGSLINTISIEALQEDLNTQNDADSEATDVIVLADLSLTFDDGQTVAVPGEQVIYTVTLVHNGGPADVTSVLLMPVLPDEILNPSFEPMSGHSYDPMTKLWTGFDLAEGEEVTMMVLGDIDPSATGQLISSVNVATHEGVFDPDPTDNSSQDVDQLADVRAPEVTLIHSVSSTGGGQLVAGESTVATLTQLLVTFNEPVEGAAVEGNYLAIAAGEDRVVETQSCEEGVRGDDEIVVIDALAYEDPTAVLWLNGGMSLPRDEYRLLICDGIEDPASNPLTETSNGFSVVVEHLLMNSNFDQSLSSWQLVAPSPAEVIYSGDDVDAASTSGSALVSGLSGPEPAVLWQCVAWNSEGIPTFGGRVKISGGSDTAPIVMGRAEVFGSTDCTGEPIGSSMTMPFVGDTEGAWGTLRRAAVNEFDGAGSILIGWMVEAGEASGFEVYFDDLFLRQGGLFSDDFESGDASRWSAVVP